MSEDKGPLTFRYEPVPGSWIIPGGLAWTQDNRQSTAFREYEYAGSASGGEGSPYLRIIGHAPLTVEYFVLAGTQDEEDQP